MVLILLRSTHTRPIATHNDHSNPYLQFQILLEALSYQGGKTGTSEYASVHMR